MNSQRLSMEFVGGISPPFPAHSFSCYMNSLLFFSRFGWGGGGALEKKEEDQSSERRDVLKHKQAWLRGETISSCLSPVPREQGAGVHQAGYTDVKSHSTSCACERGPRPPWASGRWEMTSRAECLRSSFSHTSHHMLGF